MGGHRIHELFLALGEIDHAGLGLHIRALTGYPGQNHNGRIIAHGKAANLLSGQGHFLIIIPLGHHKALHAQILMGQAPGAIFPCQKAVRLQRRAVFHALQQGDGLEIVYVAGAGAALDGIDLAHAKQRNGNRLFTAAQQRQGVSYILQQHHALRRKCPSCGCILGHTCRCFHTLFLLAFYSY